MVRRYLKNFTRHIKGRYREDPFATIVLYGLFAGAFFLIFAFRGLIGAIFLPEVDIDKSAQPVKIGGEAVSSEEKQDSTYTVQKDDTIYSLGARFAVPWTRIAEANNLEAPYELKAGQELKIPAK